MTDAEIEERCLFGLINEGAKILEEGIAYRPGDIDVIGRSDTAFPGLGVDPCISPIKLVAKRCWQKLEVCRASRRLLETGFHIGRIGQKWENLAEWSSAS